MFPAAYPAQTVYPKENPEAVGRELGAARKIAGADLEADFNWGCLISPLDKQLVFGVQHDGLVPATQVFDNLYSIGQNSVSAWAIDTRQAIIVIDALNNPETDLSSGSVAEKNPVSDMFVGEPSQTASPPRSRCETPWV